MSAPFILKSENCAFPDPREALDEPNGLLALGGDLSVERLIKAYRHGIFPWYQQGDPLLWWSPDPRSVLFVDDFHVSHSLRKRLRQKDYQIYLDRDFDGVIEGCQKPRPQGGGTWITSEMKEAYKALFKKGFAHAVEVESKGKLIGGLYGVSIEGTFFGESMFSYSPDGSKIALYCLAEHLKICGIEWLDCQIHSQHLERLGAKLISRATYLDLLEKALLRPCPSELWDKKYIC